MNLIAAHCLILLAPLGSLLSSKKRTSKQTRPTHTANYFQLPPSSKVDAIANPSNRNTHSHTTELSLLGCTHAQSTNVRLKQLTTTTTMKTRSSVHVGAINGKAKQAGNRHCHCCRCCCCHINCKAAANFPSDTFVEASTSTQHERPPISSFSATGAIAALGIIARRNVLFYFIVYKLEQCIVRRKQDAHKNRNIQLR